MQVLLILFLASLAVQYMPDTEVTPLAFDAEVFKHEFNGSGDGPKVVAVFSPT